MKHTPSPWLINVTKKHIENPAGVSITDRKGRLIASVSHDLTVVSSDEYSANAELIRSAPDLQDALQRLFDTPNGDDPVYRAKKQIAWDHAWFVLQKSKGQKA